MPENTLTIEITTGHCLGGAGNDVYPGQVLEAPRDLPLAEAMRKVRGGYARVVPTPRPVAAQPSTEPAPVDTRDPDVTTRDPEIRRPRRGPRRRRKSGEET